MKVDALLGVFITDGDLALINAVKTVFLDATNLLCRFHIDKKVQAKCKTLVGQKNAWDYVMEAWLVFFDEVINFVIVCSKYIRSCGRGNMTLMVKRRMLKL